MLSNLETEKSKLIQIVLVGQPDLRDTLETPTLEQLRQRVTVRYHIDPLDAAETANYINHRLKRAALGAPMQFSRDVTDAVHARSGGVPRLINVISDAILLCGYAEERHIVDLPLVRIAVEELEASSILRPPREAAPVAVPAPMAAPVAPAPRTTPTPAPAPAASRATFDDLPLRRDERDREHLDFRPTGMRQQATTVAPARPAAAAPAARPAATTQAPRPAPALPREAVRPVASVQRVNVAPFDSRPRSTNAWSWMKEVFFGPGPQTGRR
jgi:general secretion pathway protein A